MGCHASRQSELNPTINRILLLSDESSVLVATEGFKPPNRPPKRRVLSLHQVAVCGPKPALTLKIYDYELYRIAKVAICSEMCKLKIFFAQIMDAPLDGYLGVDAQLGEDAFLKHSLVTQSLG